MKSFPTLHCRKTHMVMYLSEVPVEVYVLSPVPV